MKIPGMLMCIALLTLWPLSSIAAENTCERCDHAPTITVTGSAYEEHGPDTAILSLAIETASLIAGKAAEENAEKSEALIGELKKLIGPGDSVKTASYSITPVYRRDDPG